MALPRVTARPVAVILAALALAILLATGGCEAIVTGDLPTFSCQGDAPGTCPSGYYCKSALCVPCNPGQCTAGDDGGGPDGTGQDGNEAGHDGPPPTDGPPADSPPGDGGGCPGALGCACSVAGDCA